MGFNHLKQFTQTENILVVDNSVIMRWLFNDSSSINQKYAHKILTQIHSRQISLLVPSLWVFESSFVIKAYVKRGEISEQDAIIKLENLFSLCQIITHEEKPVNLFNYSTQYNISSYDAGYALLAQKLDCPLSTLDKKLRKAVKRAGGKLLK